MKTKEAKQTVRQRNEAFRQAVESFLAAGGTAAEARAILDSIEQAGRECRAEKATVAVPARADAGDQEEKAEKADHVVSPASSAPNRPVLAALRGVARETRDQLAFAGWFVQAKMPNGQQLTDLTIGQLQPAIARCLKEGGRMVQMAIGLSRVRDQIRAELANPDPQTKWIEALKPDTVAAIADMTSRDIEERFFMSADKENCRALAQYTMGDKPE